MNGVCSRQYVVEADGSVYPCDFYMLDDWRLGNLTTDSSRNWNAGGRRWASLRLPAYTPRNAAAASGRPLPGRMPPGQAGNAGRSLGVNRYCGAFRSFFEYAVPKLMELVRQYSRQ